MLLNFILFLSCCVFRWFCMVIQGNGGVAIFSFISLVWCCFLNGCVVLQREDTVVRDAALNAMSKGG